MSTDGYTCFLVTSPNHNASPNQPLTGILGATATQDQHIPIWSPNLSPSNQQQAVSTANSGWNNGWNPDASIAPPAWDPASQELTQSSSHVTTGLGQRFIPAWSSVDYPSVHSNGIANNQPDPNLQLLDFGVTPNGIANSQPDPNLQLLDFGVTPNGIAHSQPDPTLQLLDFGVTPNGIANSQPDPTFQLLDFGVTPNSIANSQPDPTFQLLDFGATPNGIANSQPDPTLHLLGFGATPNGFANPNSFMQWDYSTAIDLQATMTSFNQLPFPTTTSMLAAPALPTHATSMFTAPAVPRPIARRVASHRSNVNTNPHTCNYPGCRKIFSRPGDLVRHRQQHGVPMYPCSVHGCNRHVRAFYRADKLRDHERKKHGMP